MITLIEALNFRALRYVRQPLQRFHVLVGPNATGKTTFLDVLPFLGDALSVGIQEAIRSRTGNYADMFYGKQGDDFQLAVEASIPLAQRALLPGESGYETVRYELKVGLVPETRQIGILGEKVVLKQGPTPTSEAEFGDLFPRDIQPPKDIYSPRRQQKNARLVLHKNPEGNDNFYSEVSENRGGGWLPSFRFGPSKSALANVPDDGTRFPVSLWLRDFLMHDVQNLVLNSRAIRLASPAGQSRGFRLDGSNLPWVIQGLRQSSPKLFHQWVSHIQSALPDIEDITTIEREDDKHLYLEVRYRNKLAAPSWMVSDGTLRLLALTLPAYLPDFRGVLLIEEPENGIHPRAIETVVQSLSNVYDAQVLCATHSPVIVNAVTLEEILCFQKDDNGATDIVAGPHHPALREWKKEANLGLLFAAGILG